MCELIFQTRTGAAAAASARAQRLSPSQSCTYIAHTGPDYVSAAVRPTEGGPAFAVEMLTEGWKVIQLTDEQLAARVRAGRAADHRDLLERARLEDTMAEQRLGKYAERHRKDAERYRAQAAELERLLSEVA